eukprot:scaffold10310_cov181-Alexandrium_tamarense.AAC.1
MNDIARIREEFATLIDRLSPKYLAIKDAEEKAAKRAKKNAVAGEKTVEKAVTVAASSTRRRRKEGVTKRLPKAPSNSEFYEEETAWRFHNPDFALDENDNLTVSRDASIPSLTPPTSHKLLKCIPPPPPLPTLPSTGFCAWSFDSDSRVLLANFRDPILAETTKGKVTIVHEDEVFLFKMMERDDITVISEGLADEINPSLWNKEYIRNCIGSEFHHKFRGFEKSSHKSFGGDVADDEDKGETVVQYEEMKN